MLLRTPPHIKMQLLRRAKKPLVAITTIHEADAIWIDQLLAEYDRLGWEVAWHFNNLSEVHCNRLAHYKGTIGFSWALPNGPVYSDYDHTYPMLLAEEAGASWLCVHNADETMEPRTVELLPDILKVRKVHILRWYNIWQVEPNGLMIRSDPPFVGHKTKFYPIDKKLGWECYFKGGVSTMYMRTYPPGNPVWSDLRILHWGFSTPDLRSRHYNQWKGTNTTEKVNSDYWDMTVKPEWLSKVRLKRFDPNQSHAEFMAS